MAYITSLVINALGGGHTDTHTHTHTHTHTNAQTKSISKNQACAAEGRAPGLKRHKALR